MTTMDDEATRASDEAIQDDLDGEMLLAELAHEINRAYCEAIRDHSQRPWAEAEDWQRESAIQGVVEALAGKTPAQLHESWMAVKVAEGWVHGPYKDPSIKQHPCLVPYHKLPAEQQVKDHLFRAAILHGKALIDRLTRED